MRYVNLNFVLAAALSIAILGAAYLFAPLLTTASINYQMSLRPPIVTGSAPEREHDVLKDFSYPIIDEYTEQFLIFDLKVDPESRMYEQLPYNWYTAEHNWM